MGIVVLMQYGALRRKIGGTYKDFFKSYIEGIDAIKPEFNFSKLGKV